MLSKSYLHASERNMRSFMNMDTYPKKTMKPLRIATAIVKAENSPGIRLTAMGSRKMYVKQVRKGQVQKVENTDSKTRHKEEQKVGKTREGKREKRGCYDKDEIFIC